MLGAKLDRMLANLSVGARTLEWRYIICNMSNSSCAILSGDADGTVKLWDFTSQLQMIGARIVEIEPVAVQSNILIECIL